MAMQNTAYPTPDLTAKRPSVARGNSDLSNPSRETSSEEEDKYGSLYTQAGTRRVTVQDLEGDCSLTFMMLVPDTLEVMLEHISVRFGYKSGRCSLYTRYGAPVDNLYLIKDDEILYAADGGEYPQQLREALHPGLDEIGQWRSAIIERYQVWGWPRIGQLVGGEEVRLRLQTAFRTSALMGGLIFALDFFAFMYPPSLEGPPSNCSSTDHAVRYLQVCDLVRAYFWFAGLGLALSMVNLMLAILLSVQLNLLPSERDVFWFLKQYGHWLFGWPTTCLLFALCCTAGFIIIGALIVFPSEKDSWAFVGISCCCFSGLMFLFLTLSTATWRRINGMDIRKVSYLTSVNYVMLLSRCGQVILGLSRQLPPHCSASTSIRHQR
uniref:PB1 domain-containing protein n=1 Tax=Guillardia theta TaxID=55529 RepID=A0A6U6A443_GUITH|mmetsp:Transcript_30190/g.97152  ORF Transcript_30190/g.97152 Transcript_30190/m.97152 type:complete len:380 (+) Transcript_30190:487-1626(+)